jgi:signal peptidase I
MRKILWSLFEIIETVAVAVIAVVLVRAFIIQPFVVSGASMEPTFYNGNYLLIDELTYRFRTPERGEVIVFKYPGDKKSFYIKRIIGLPGERVVLDRGQITVFSGENEISLDETYLRGRFTQGSFEITLSNGEYFVMGDNRNFSFDSRSWGPLPTDDIIGAVRLRLWPINEVRAFVAPEYAKQ